MLIVAWETTSACNLRCSYCRASATPAPADDELSTKEALLFMDQLVPYKPMLILSGGEPLLRDDIFLLAKAAIRKGIRVSLATNGTLLLPETADKIASSGISRVSVSLDGAKQETHDAIRGSGSYNQAILGIENLQDKVDFQINFTVTKNSSSEILPIFDLSERLGAKALHFFFLVPTGRGSARDQISPEMQDEILHLIDDERSRRAIEFQVTCAPQYARIARHSPGRGIERMGRRSGGCLAGTSFIFISRSGKVYPCGYMPLLAGDIRGQSFSDIWEKSAVLTALRERKLKGRCGSCSFARTCGGCRARAFAATGDSLEADPLCSYEVA